MVMVVDEGLSLESLMEHLSDAFQFSKTLIELSPMNGEAKDAFADDLQVLVRKIVAQKSSFHLEANH